MAAPALPRLTVPRRALRRLALAALLTTITVGCGPTRLPLGARLECGAVQPRLCAAAADVAAGSGTGAIVAAAVGPSCPPGGRGCAFADEVLERLSLNVVLLYEDGRTDLVALEGEPGGAFDRAWVHPGAATEHVAAQLGRPERPATGPVVEVILRAVEQLPPDGPVS